MSKNKEKKSSIFYHVVLTAVFVCAFAFVWFAGYVYADTNFQQNRKTTSVVIAVEPAERFLPTAEDILASAPAVLKKSAQNETAYEIEDVAEKAFLSEPHNVVLMKEMEMLEQEPFVEIEEAVENESAGNAVQSMVQNESEFEVEDFEEPAMGEKSPTFYVAVVIDDMGISPRRTEEMLSIKAPISSSFLTYGKNLKEFCKEAEEAGHEVMMHTPMEPKVQADLAPDTLKISMSDEEIEKAFFQMLAKFDGENIKGINNHMGSLFTESAQKLDAVMKILKAKNMYFLDSKTSKYSQGENVAEMEGVPYVARDVFLDNDNDYEKIRTQLSKLERIAQKNGFAVAIGHPKTQTFAALRDWVQTLDGKNIKLVHLSDIVDLKYKKNEK